MEVQYLLGHPETKAIIGLGSTPLTVAPKAIEEAKMQIPIGGFDLTLDIIDGIEKGIITATVDQQPYSQGFYAVAQLALYVKYGLYPSDMNTGGLGLVDKTNVAKVKELVPQVPLDPAPRPHGALRIVGATCRPYRRREQANDPR